MRFLNILGWIFLYLMLPIILVIILNILLYFSIIYSFFAVIYILQLVWRKCS